MSIAVGVYGGVFPIWGTQSLVCMALGVPLGAHVVVYVAGEEATMTLPFAVLTLHPKP